LKGIKGEIFVSASCKIYAVLINMKQNYRSSKLKNPHSEFTDNKRMDWQILPTNFAIILMAFLLLMHNEHGRVAKNATN